MNSEIELLDDIEDEGLISEDTSDDSDTYYDVIESDGIIKIKVFGVGGCGSNAVDNMIRSKIVSTEFLSINTDVQILNHSLSQGKLQIGKKLTQGMGAGADPNKGAKAAQESREDIIKHLQGVKMLFITAGMGGGTGTGAAPVIANISKEMGILTIGVVTKPFDFEGASRMNSAIQGIENLRKNVDALLVVPNDKLLHVLPKGTPVIKAFLEADEVLKKAITGITDLITTPSLINLDFADVKKIVENAGVAHIGVGIAEGENRAINAIQAAVASPLLDTTIYGAKGLIINITGGYDLAIDEVYDASKLLNKVVDPAANIIFGAAINKEYNGKIAITLIATGFADASSAMVRNKREEINNLFESINRNKITENEQKNNIFQARDRYSQSGQADNDYINDADYTPIDNINNARNYDNTNRYVNNSDENYNRMNNMHNNTFNNDNNDDGDDTPDFIKFLRGKR